MTPRIYPLRSDNNRTDFVGTTCLVAALLAIGLSIVSAITGYDIVSAVQHFLAVFGLWFSKNPWAIVVVATLIGAMLVVANSKTYELCKDLRLLVAKRERKSTRTPETTTWAQVMERQPQK
jgi:hypothetical protein